MVNLTAEKGSNWTQMREYVYNSQADMSLSPNGKPRQVGSLGAVLLLIVGIFEPVVLSNG